MWRTPGNEISIVLSGEAGHGLQTLEILLVRAFKLSGFCTFSCSEFMSRIRGGNNSTQIVVSSKRVRSCRDRIDLFIPLKDDAYARLESRITGGTLVLAEQGTVPGSVRQKQPAVAEIPFARLARESGGGTYLTAVLLGVVAGLFSLDPGIAAEVVESAFAGLSGDQLEANRTALGKGYEASRGITVPSRLAPGVPRDPERARDLVLNGVEAVGLGGLAGGCTFISSYPMSPSTGVLVFFAQHAGQFGVVVEQAEDEISAVNMCIGAWYAGSRAMVTTSGGGFALMTEAVSLAGCTETPLVVHIGQRPGPATGLPTRTEQGDLNLALYAGHGEFPRIILAPGSVQEAFTLACASFDLADRFQVPVFLLTDQHLLESNITVPGLETGGLPPWKPWITETDAGYARYRITEDGISPRGIPGWGDGLVCCDSDEHDEGGRITEDPAMRTAMMDKRMRKLSAITGAARPPSLVGPPGFTNLIVGWGSTLNVVGEALELLGREDTAFLHFSQVYPLHPDAAALLKRAKKRIVVENNAAAPFAALLLRETGVETTGKILKYSGMPFTVEEVAARILEELGG